jgi:heme exporter protein A
VQLVAENLVLERGERTIVDDLSFTLEDGEVLILTGPNGSGKTTLLRALAGFLPPASGAVRLVEGPQECELSEICHFVGHLDGLKPHLTLKENLLFWADYLAGAFDRDWVPRVYMALEHFGLRELADIPAGYLSDGQKRRLAIARLLAVRRPLWLLDEPTVSLDAAAINALVDALDEHVINGGIAIIATHVPLPIVRYRSIDLGRAESAS